MSNKNIIRAWKDEDYFDSLSEEERSLLPENPAGMIEMSDEDMESVAGGHPGHRRRRKRRRKRKRGGGGGGLFNTYQCVVLSNFCGVEGV